MITREINFYLTPIFNKCPLCIKRFNNIAHGGNTDTLSHCFLSIFLTPMQFFFKLYCAEYHVYLCQNTVLDKAFLYQNNNVVADINLDTNFEFIKSPRSIVSSHRVLTENTEAIHELSPVIKILR